MIRGYSRPQLLIQQVLANLPNTQTRSLNAFYAGPQFDLFRYTNATERAAMKGVAFAENASTDPADRQLVPYEGLKSTHIIDSAFVKLYGENLEGQYWKQVSAVQNTDASLYQFKLLSIDTPNKVQVIRRGAVIQATASAGAITGATVVFGGSGYPVSSTIDQAVIGGAGSGAYVRLTINSSGVVGGVTVISGGSGYTSNVVFTAASTVLGSNVGIKNTSTGDDVNGDGVTDYPLLPELHGRPVKPGDVVYLTLDSDTTRRTIRSIERELLPSHFGTDTGKANKQFAASSLNPSRTDTASFGNTSAPFSWTIGHSGTWDGLVAGSIFNGQYGDRYTITVTKGGTGSTPQVRIRTNSGAFAADNVAVTQPGGVYTITDPSIGGLTITITNADTALPLNLGDQFSFVVVGAYNPLNLSGGGQVSGVVVNSGGNYSVLPTTVVFSAPPPGGVQATGTVQGVGTAVTAITITNPGSGYVAPPTITLTGGTVVAAATLTVSITAPETARDITVVQSSVYTGPSNTRYKLEVIKGTSLTNIADSFTGGIVRVSDMSGIDAIQEYTIAQGTVYPLGTFGLQFEFPASVATPGGLGGGSTATGTFRLALDGPGAGLTAIAAAGTGFTAGDVLSLTGGTHSITAQITVTSVSGGGAVTGFTVSTPGLYTAVPSAPATMATSGGTGTGFTINPGWHIVSVNVTSAGSGYVAAPTLTIGVSSFTPVTGAVLTPDVVAGAIETIEVIDGGSGYQQMPTLTVSAPQLFQPGLRTGDVYFVDAVAASQTGSASVIVLSGQAADVSGWTDVDLKDNVFDMDFRELQTGLVLAKTDDAPNLAWAAGATADGGIFVKHNLTILDEARNDGFQWLPVKNSAYARLFASWRGLVPTTSADKITLYTSEEDIIARYGVFDPDNTLCYGSIIGFRGAQQKPVFVLGLATNDLAGYQAVIRQAERVDGIYAICPFSYDLGIKNAWKDHVDKMSLKNWKLWRRAYISTKNPGPYSVMTTDGDGNNFEAQVLHNAQGNVRVICTNGDFLIRGIVPGDLFRVNFVADAWGVETFSEFVVENVLENDELVLVTGPNAPISPAARFEIWKPDNGLSQAQFVADNSNSFLDRRVINVWCDSPFQADTSGALKPQELYYLSAEIAGLRSAVLPQQGLTYTELDFSVTSAPLMFTKYSQEELDVAAASGTFIVTQDVDDGVIYIRHQLTTDAQDSLGPLFWEDSVGTNLDNIAYSVKDLFQPYIGKRNANPETLEEMETKLRDLLNGFKANPGGFSQIGPALADWSNLSVQIDPVFKDRVNVIVTLQLPLPINTITVTLQATTIADATFIQFQAAQLAAAA